MVTTENERRRLGTDLLIALLWSAWGLGTPYLLFGYAISSASFFGEAPDADEMHQAFAYLYAGLACGLLVPVVGMLVAARAGRRVAAWLFAVALTPTLALLLACLPLR